MPTGSIIKYIELHHAVANATAGSAIVLTNFGYTLNNGALVIPASVGGDTQRNQIIHMSKFAVSADGAVTRVYRFKIPKQFQRLREGMRWTFGWNNSATLTSSILCIYKFYS